MKSVLRALLHTSAALAASASLSTLAGQTRTSDVVIAGYGSATYEATLVEGFPNNFTASVSPILLYSMGDDLLFETELEFGLSGELTTTSLEYAQIDYQGFENLQIIAGKFLVPFGLFSERLHPTWINKLPSAPVVFGHAHGGVAEESLLPVLSDAGVMLRVAKPFGTDWSFDLTGYVSQGPIAAADDADHGGAVEEGHGSLIARGAARLTATGNALNEEIPAVGFGVGFADNNSNKMIGARVGFVKGGTFEAYLSGFQARYDPESILDYWATALSVQWRPAGFDLLGEGVVTSQEFERAEGFATLNRSGFYIQAARRYGPWEPVARFGYQSQGKVNSDVITESHTALALGLDYWLDTTVPLKFMYEFHEEKSDQLVIQWGFGF